MIGYLIVAWLAPTLWSGTVIRSDDGTKGALVA